MTLSPSVFVIILNYNLLDDLKDTVKSFLNQECSNLNIVVSDNGSSDNSVEWLEKYHPNIVVLKNEDNLGWAEGNNVGIRYALQQNADYILLANNDLFFENVNLVSSLVKTLKQYPRAIIGPKQYYYDQPKTTFTEGRILLENKIQSFNRFREIEKFGELPVGNFNVVDYVPGSFMLIPSEIFQKIGLIDADYYLYGEDTDFSLRAWKEGYVSIVDKDLEIYHKVSATTSNGLSKIKVYYQARNVWLLLKKNRWATNNSVYFRYWVFKKMLKKAIKYCWSSSFQHTYFYILGSIHGMFGIETGQYKSVHKE